MYDLADYKRTNHKRNYIHEFPKGILDVVEADYPNRYFLLLEGQTQMTTLFSNEEWVDILIKSRDSYQCHIQRMNLTRKYSAQGI